MDSIVVTYEWAKKFVRPDEKHILYSVTPVPLGRKGWLRINYVPSYKEENGKNIKLPESWVVFCIRSDDGSTHSLSVKFNEETDEFIENEYSNYDADGKFIDNEDKVYPLIATFLDFFELD